MRTIPTLVTLLAFTGVAHADDEAAGILLDVTQILPKDGVHAGAVGPGAEIRFVPDEECMTASIGGFAAIGTPGTEQRRDVLDVHFQIGFKAERKSLAPYGAIGLDVLQITTHQPERTLRGTTLGLTAQVGVLGTAGDKLMYRASVGYLGAIVPGTGEDLGGWMLQVGLGWRIND